MKIAFTSKGNDLNAQVDARFGRCPFIVILNTDDKSFEVIDNQSSADEAHGAGTKTAQKLSEYDCNVLITGNGPGGNASTLLEKLNIDIYIGAGDMLIDDALKAFNSNSLKKF